MPYKTWHYLIKSQALVTYSNSAGDILYTHFVAPCPLAILERKEHGNFHRSARSTACPQIIPCGAGRWNQSQALSPGLPGWSEGCVCSQPSFTASRDKWLHTDHYNCFMVPGEMLFKLKNGTGMRTNVSKLDIIAFTLIIKGRFLIKFLKSSQNY